VNGPSPKAVAIYAVQKPLNLNNRYLIKTQKAA